MVTALILLGVLALLGVVAIRGSMFTERMSANDRDLAIARESAELALRDAERDVQGLRFDGQYCRTAGGCGTLRPVGTRPSSAADAQNFWNVRTLMDMAADLAYDDGGLSQSANSRGVYTARSALACGKPVWSGADWGDGVTRTCAGAIAAAVPTVAYGSFTGAINPSFAANNVPLPRYLVEMFSAEELGIAPVSSKLFFRITAVGFGRTRTAGGAPVSVTLQSVFSPL